MSARPDALFFDLDGTLIDSAPDLAAAGNEMRLTRGLPELPYESFRPMVGSGARGMLGVAFAIDAASAEFEDLKTEFLQRYELRMTRDTRVFEHLHAMLDALDEARQPWGIVTNKAERFARPLTQALGLAERAGVLICGDTTAHAKPHPAPLLEAARRLGKDPSRCTYVGDDVRDVLAGRAAGMTTIAVGWGYLGVGAPIGEWGADHVVHSAGQLLQCVGMA